MCLQTAARQWANPSSSSLSVDPSTREGLLRPRHPGPGSRQRVTLSTDLASYLKEPSGVLFFLLVPLSQPYLTDKGDSSGEPEIIFLITHQIFTKHLPCPLQCAGRRDTEVDQTGILPLKNFQHRHQSAI